MTRVDICVQSFFFHTCSYVVTIISGFNTNKPFKMPTKHLSEFNTTCPIYLMTCHGQCREAKHVQILHEIYRVVLTMAQCWKVHLGLSWLPYPSYLYFDFHLCSMTKLKEHSREIYWEKHACIRNQSNLLQGNEPGWEAMMGEKEPWLATWVTLTTNQR